MVKHGKKCRRRLVKSSTPAIYYLMPLLAMLRVRSALRVTAVMRLTVTEHLLLATYDYAYRLHIYRIEIAWNLTTSVPSQQAQAIPSVSPQLHAAHLTSLDHCLPEPPSQNRTAANAFVPPPRPSPCHLSHLYIIAPSPATVGAETSPSQVMALFLHRSSLFDLSEQSQSYHTSICRWEISRVDSGMHSSFQLLKGENTNGTSTQVSSYGLAYTSSSELTMIDLHYAE